MIGKATLLCVGNLKESYWREACAEYQKRLSAYFQLTILEIAEERAPKDPSPAQIEAVIKAEGERILSKIPVGSAIVPLCIEGKELSSPSLAKELDRFAVNGNGHITFVIGGSFGLSDEVKSKAVLRLSMSPMTFPHQLARVMLLEQLYRAAQISSGGKYHK